jgi:hypothetical protein
MSTIRGVASSVYVVTEEELQQFRLEEVLVATPVFGVPDGSTTEKGNPLPVYFINSSDLVENGGRYKLEKGNPTPINTYVNRNSPVGRVAIAVYLVGGVRWSESVLPSVEVTPAVAISATDAIAPTVQLGSLSLTPSAASVASSAVAPTVSISTPDHGTLEYWYFGELTNIGPKNSGVTDTLEHWYGGELLNVFSRR